MRDSFGLEELMTRRMMISALTSVLILVVLVTSRGQSVSNVVYHDPQHRFTVKVPDGWTVDTPGKVVFKRGKNVVVVNPSADSLQRLVQGLKLSPSAVLTALQKSADEQSPDELQPHEPLARHCLLSVMVEHMVHAPPERPHEIIPTPISCVCMAANPATNASRNLAHIAFA